MTSRKFWTILTIAAAAFCITGCKDKDEEEVLKKMNGAPELSGIPSFVRPGETFTVECSGLRTMDTTKLRYSWSAPDFICDSSSTNSTSILIPDTLLTTTVSCTVLATGFSSNTAQQMVTVVDPAKSIKGLSHNPEGGTFIDTRDGREYHYTSIGGLDWFDTNLAYEGVGVPYEDSPAMKDIFGGYYTWNEAMEACPEGWRIPTESDWKKLAEAVTGKTFEGECPVFLNAGQHTMALTKFNNNSDYMWDIWPQMEVDNSTYLNIMPTGYGFDSGDKGLFFTGVNEYGFFWTGTETEDGKAIARYFTVTKDRNGVPATEILAKKTMKDNFMFSLRPVRDSQ